MSLPSAPPLQQSADKFAEALVIPRRLLNLAPANPGHPGNAAVISPAIALTVIAAFEGFAEDFLAAILWGRGIGFAEIARQVGNWNNPTLADWCTRLEALVSTGAVTRLRTGPSIPIRHHRINVNGNWSSGPRTWANVLRDSEAWMQVRHLLSHGLNAGWRAETWPPPLKPSVPPASSVLRPATNPNLRSLDRSCAVACARIYTKGARFVADVVAADFGVALDWSALPTF